MEELMQWIEYIEDKRQELLNRNEGEILRKMICIDEKTMCGKKGEMGDHRISYLHGVKKMVSVWDRMQWTKRATRLLQSQNY